jgi:hypothetical protein
MIAKTWAMTTHQTWCHESAVTDARAEMPGLRHARKRRLEEAGDRNVVSS